MAPAMRSTESSRDVAGGSTLERVESVVLFVPDVDAAAAWYAALFGTTVQHENPHYAFVRGPGVLVGFHPADAKCPGGIGGTSVYWEVGDLVAALARLQAHGARLHRGPACTDLGAKVALLADPFGCTIGLNQSSTASLRAIHELERPSQAQAKVPSRTRLMALGGDDEADFLAGVAASRALHGHWVSPPSDTAGFRTMLARLRAPANRGFALRRLDTQALAGYVELTQIVHGAFCSAYLAYYAFAGHERQGLMKDGLQSVVRLAFSKLGLRRLEANMQPGNTASAALARACGFTREGYSPRYLKIRGRWRDHERWARVAR